MGLAFALDLWAVCDRIVIRASLTLVRGTARKLEIRTMANHKSAAKKARRDVEARLRNRSNRSTLKSAVKTFLALITVGKKDEAAKLLPATQGLVDKACRKGVMHKNAADRTKSRLAAKVNKLA